jgi:hypothetical protein
MISFASAFNWSDGVESYYKLDGNDFSDATPNGNDLINQGTINASGKIIDGRSFDGINDYLSDNDNPIMTQNEGTFSAWIYPALSQSQVIVAKGTSGAATPYTMFWIKATGEISFEANSNFAFNYPIGTTTAGEWNHVVLKSDGVTTELYVNGVHITKESSTGVDGSWWNDQAGDTFAIGVLDRSSDFSPFDGTIDEVGLWNRSLSESEISELWNSGDGLAYGGTALGIPSITLESPTNGTVISDVGTNFTVSGNNISDFAATWTNLTYNVWQNSTLLNSTTISLSSVNFTETQFIDNFTFTDYEWNAEACYTNVTGDYCISAANNNTFSVSLFTIISESYVNDTISGTLEDFSISIDLLEGYSLLDASFMYNGTDNTPSITAEGDNRFLLVSDYQIPILVTDENISFYWGLTFTGDIELNSTERTQLVRAVLLDDCSVYTNQIFNISLFDEELKTTLLGDIEITYTLLNMPSYQTINTYSFEADNVSNVGVCSGINLSEEDMAYSAEIRYVSDGYAPELYHIQRAEIGSEVQSINLFDLNSNESTEFKITYQDDTFNFVEGAIVQLQRKYISEGIYEVVEAPLTSRDGVAVVHIDLDSIKYKATIVKNGVVLDIFDNLVFKCESELTGECTQKLLGAVNPQNSQDVSNLIDFSYIVSRVNNTITTTFTIPSVTPSSVNILLKQVDSFGTTIMCNSTVISSAGSIDCDYNATIGDSRVYLTISKDGVIYVNTGYFIEEDLDLGFASNNYLIVLMLLLTLVGMAFASPEWIVIIGIVAFVIAGGLWLINGMNIVIGLGMMIFIIIAAAVIIMKMTKQEDQ